MSTGSLRVNENPLASSCRAGCPMQWGSYSFDPSGGTNAGDGGHRSRANHADYGRVPRGFHSLRIRCIVSLRWSRLLANLVKSGEGNSASSQTPAPRLDSGFIMPSVPIGSQTHYATVLVTIYHEAGAWIIKLTDPFGLGTVSKTGGSESAAKQHALAVAHGYLTNTYPDISWPVISDERIRWRKTPK